jgi:putative nucleotidyltransferase with HDIG domain
MPVMDGYEMCRIIKHDETLKDIPIILFTSLSDPEDVIRSLDVKADGYITKSNDDKYLIERIEHLLTNIELRKTEPAQTGVEVHFAGKNYTLASPDRRQVLDLLLSTFENAIQQNRELTKTQLSLKTVNEQLEELVKQRTQELQQSLAKLQKMMDNIVLAMALMSEMRDPYIAGRQERVACFATAIAKEMGLSEDQVKGIHTAALLHDIGNISVPSEILMKPGRLNESEFNIVKNHTQAGYEILKRIEFPWPVAQVALQHHERLDGSGYPSGISGEEIILEARIIAVADVIEAASSHRRYRPALDRDKILEEISKGSGVLYDPKVVSAAMKVASTGIVE